MRMNKYMLVILFTVVVAITIGMTISEVTLFSIHPSVTYQGDTMLLQSSREGWVEFNGEKYQLQTLNHQYVALVPIPLNQKPGTYEILWHPIETLIHGNITALQEIKKAKVVINKKEFSTQYLEVTKEQQTMVYNDEKIKEDRIKYTGAMKNPIEEPLFKEEFIQPVEGRITTMYGYTRYINGVLDSTHQAMDIAAPMGTPILAPNHGKIVLAAELYLSGNRVIIDHGGTLHTSFSHLSKLNVSVGEYVKKGDIIGWVGSTGFSTGPHLHHAVYVHGYPVNPEQFFGANPLSW